MQDALGLTAAENAWLDRHGFARGAFLPLAARLRAGELTSEHNRLKARVEAPAPEDLAHWPTPDTATARSCDERGRQAIAAGTVAAVILNGGMATRFGGVVKGVVDVDAGRSFLALKLRDLAEQPGPVEVFILCSFATRSDTERHLASIHFAGVDRARVHLLEQSSAPRLTPTGELFRDARGELSPYAPGHGDVFPALTDSPAYQAFVRRGGKTIVVSNVDNLGATLSPTVLGAHLASGKPCTVELAEKLAGDAGGAPARVDGRLEIVEGFRFPRDFDARTIPVFNTNTLWLETSHVRGDFPLQWFRADKEVGGRPAVQLERLMGEVTHFVDAHYLVVPRTGPVGRFLPVKAPADLDVIRQEVRTRWPARPNDAHAPSIGDP